MAIINCFYQYKGCHTQTTVWITVRKCEIFTPKLYPLDLLHLLHCSKKLKGGTTTRMSPLNFHTQLGCPHAAPHVINVKTLEVLQKYGLLERSLVVARAGSDWSSEFMLANSEEDFLLQDSLFTMTFKIQIFCASNHTHLNSLLKSFIICSKNNAWCVTVKGEGSVRYILIHIPVLVQTGCLAQISIKQKNLMFGFVRSHLSLDKSHNSMLFLKEIISFTSLY